MTGDVEGEAFGRYRLLEVLRWGGCIGTVYRARDTVMTREVAVKVIPGEPEYQDRFRREVSVAARLNNPNIIPVYEAGEIDGRLYLVMPLVDGIDLQTLLHRDGPLSPELAVRVVEQAAAALEAGPHLRPGSRGRQAGKHLGGRRGVRIPARFRCRSGQLRPG